MSPWELRLGDCLDPETGLASLASGSVDAVVTDPPYGIGEARGKNKSRGKPDKRGVYYASVDYGVSDWDDEPCSPEALEQMRRVSRLQVIFGGNFFQLPPSPCWLVWDKENGDSDFADCELAWTNMPRAVRRFRWLWNGFARAKPEARYHPTQKPLAVMEWAIRLLDLSPGALIVDPFAGSGTTGVAALQMGFRFLGWELKPQHHATAVKRLSAAREQLRMFG